MKYQFPMIVWAMFERVMNIVQGPFRMLKSLLICKAYGLTFPAGGEMPVFRGKTIIRTRTHGEISLGSGCVFDADVKHNLVGLSGPTILDTRHGGSVVIGDNSGFSSVVVSSKTSVRIGSRVRCGGNVRIFDHDFHSLSAETRAKYATDVVNIRSKPVDIGNDVFIGTSAMILKGSIIGDRSIVAAGAVVFGLVAPPDSLIKGNPATVVEKRK